MAEPFRLAALDFCLTPPGGDAVDALSRTLELVQALESFGYTRYWLAEHHSSEVAHSSPEILVPLLAGMTERIRLGPAGILLSYYSPFKVASDFRLLNALFPGRIDLGLGRGRATDPRVEDRLHDGRPDRPSYEDKVRELAHLLRGTGEVPANPLGVAPPEVWVLGSSASSTRIAAEIGAAFCFALFFDREVDLEEVLEEYRSAFRPSPELAAPKWGLALAGACHEDEARARRIAEANRTFVTPSLVGTPDQCAEAVRALRERHGTGEIVFLDLGERYEDRVESYRLLARSLGVTP